jgi:hypothetical protein
MADSTSTGIIDQHTDPVRVCNPDMELLAFKWERIAEEAMGAQSTETSEVHPSDVKRFLAYFTDIEKWANHAHDAPRLDMPETSKRAWLVQPETVLRRIENDALFTVARFAIQFRDETLSSQSARMGNGMRDDDFERHTAAEKGYVVKMRKLFNDYVAAQLPQDQPASSPSFPTVDTAKHGV